MDENKNTSKKRRSSRGERICEDLSFAAKEAFKRLRTNLIMGFPEDDGCKLLGITSAQPGDGKSTVAINLSYNLAELGKKVLLIDADMRRSSIHTKIGVERTPGLYDLLSQASDISSILNKYTSSTGTTFDILTSGDAPNNPSELLNSKRMSTLLKTLSTVYDFVVLDLPPVGSVIDAVSVSRHLDGMLVVIRENTCPRKLLEECMSQLSYAGVNILGFVVNGAIEGSGKRYQYGKYGSYNSYYRYY